MYGPLCSIVDRPPSDRELSLDHIWFTWTTQGLLATSGMGAPWTLSIVVGFGGFEPPVGAAVAVALAFGTERLLAHEVSDPGGLGLNEGDSRPTNSKGMHGIGGERQR